MKKLIAIIFLAACGSQGNDQFYEDFGTNKIEFHRCEQGDVSLIFDSTIEYIQDTDSFILDFQGIERPARLKRNYPISSGLGDILWYDPSEDMGVFRGFNGKAILSFDQYLCYE